MQSADKQTSSSHFPPLLAKSGEQAWQMAIEKHPELTQLSVHKKAIIQGFGLSNYIFDSCMIDPLILFWLFDQHALDTHRENFSQKLQGLLEDTGTEEQLYELLRKFKRRHMVRIAWRDLIGISTITESLGQVSDLADTLINGAYHRIHQQVRDDLGCVNNFDPLVILGMGKLGAQELNFSSDIDLIFLTTEQGSIKTKFKSKDLSQIYTKIAQKLISALNNYTTDGYVFRVDMRLRPYGESGPLVMHVDAFENYLYEQGRDWERFAMMKSRIINPTRTNESQFDNVIRPFVYRKYVDFGTVEALRKMKRLINQEVNRKRLKNNIKLGPGGIREIEFIIQSIQLIQGGKNAALRHRHLLSSLSALYEANLMDKTEYNALYDAYLFLRKSEHSIQQFNDEQSQTLPENLHGEASLYCSLGFENYASFVQKLEYHLNQVNAYFDDLIKDKNSQEQTPVHNDAIILWQSLSHSSMLSEDYQPQSEDAQNYQLFIAPLKSFSDDLHAHRPGAKGTELLEQIIPSLLTQLTEGSEKTQGSQKEKLLERILTIIKAISKRTSYLQLLHENPGVMGQLIKLCDASPWIASQLEKYPLLLDELIDPVSLQNPPDMDQYDDLLRQQFLRIPDDDHELQLEVLRQFKLSHQLRVASADISGYLPVMQVSDQLTFLAQACIKQSVLLAWRQITTRYGSPAGTSELDMGIAVIAYGKLGGIELGYGSDLDLVFLHDHRGKSRTDGPKQIDGRAFYVKLIQRVMHIMTVKTATGPLYDVDLRLRPSGSSGLIVCSMQGYADYLKQDAWTWEHQALVRARCILGSSEIHQQFSEIRYDRLENGQHKQNLKLAISQMRQKMRDNTSVQLNDFKHCPGGLIDIEFLVQYWIMQHIQDFPELAKWSDNVRQLKSLVSLKIISKDDTCTLLSTYIDLRNHMHHSALAEAPLPAAEVLLNNIAAVEKIWQRNFSEC